LDKVRKTKELFKQILLKEIGDCIPGHIDVEMYTTMVFQDQTGQFSAKNAP